MALKASLVTGQQATTTAAAALPAKQLYAGVVLKAKATNAGTIWIGDASVTATDNGTGPGFALAPGDQCFFAISDLSVLSMIGANTTDVLYWQGS